MININSKWRWNELITTSSKYFQLDIDVTFTDYYYKNVLMPAYTKDRYYHTIEHIVYMLKHSMDFKGMSHRDRALLKWAIWFHDIMCVPGNNDNEIKSANMLADFMGALDFEEEDIKIAKWIILVTTVTATGNPQTQLEDIICDLDFREFVSDRWELNVSELRKEHHLAPDEQWKIGRINFLQTMLDKEYIYHTDLYRETLEAQARSNLTKEIEYLKTQ